jgi:hypothetical protein
VRLAGGVALAEGAAAVGHRRVERLLGLRYPVAGGVILGLGVPERGLGLDLGVLGRGQPAAHLGELPFHLAAPLCPV